MKVSATDAISAADRVLAGRFSRFAWFVLAVNLAVIVWGGFVRASGSGAGCGAHWPLCNGVVVPQDPKIETLIELGHRVTSGLALVVVVALGVWTLRRYSKRTAAADAGCAGSPGSPSSSSSARRRSAPASSCSSTSARTAPGARAVWMAGHLVNTFLLLAILALLAERSRRRCHQRKASSKGGALPARPRVSRRAGWSFFPLLRFFSPP